MNEDEVQKCSEIITKIEKEISIENGHLRERLTDERYYALRRELMVREDKVVVPEEKWLQLMDILEDIAFLYNEYGLEDDSKLTSGAKELKKRILAIKNDFKLEKLKELIKDD